MAVIPFDPTRPQFVDVSHYHPIVDFAAYAAATGARALGFKVTEGSYLDPATNDHLAGAEAAGLVCIGYEYGLVNVNTFLGCFPPKAGRIPVLDFEGASLSVSGAEAWIKVVQAAYGRYPWFYGHSEWLAQGAPGGTEIANCPYWGARYGGPLEIPNGVGQPVAFQFTDGSNGPSPHIFPGVSGNCDVNMLIIEPAELPALSTWTSPPSQAPAFPGRDLKLASPLMTGKDVQAWQTQLLARGWMVVGTADGSFGPHTDAATRGLQAAANLGVDGVVAATTWAAAWISGAGSPPAP
jgi:lysozyme